MSPVGDAPGRFATLDTFTQFAVESARAVADGGIDLLSAPWRAPSCALP